MNYSEIFGRTGRFLNRRDKAMEKASKNSMSQDILWYEKEND
jgi:hypothetical protein